MGTDKTGAPCYQDTGRVTQNTPLSW
jgi:hypothetical protein